MGGVNSLRTGDGATRAQSQAQQDSGHLDEVVRSTVEETLNALLDVGSESIVHGKEEKGAEETRAGSYKRGNCRPNKNRLLGISVQAVRIADDRFRQRLRRAGLLNGIDSKLGWLRGLQCTDFANDPFQSFAGGIALKWSALTSAVTVMLSDCNEMISWALNSPLDTLEHSKTLGNSQISFLAPPARAALAVCPSQSTLTSAVAGQRSAAITSEKPTSRIDAYPF